MGNEVYANGMDISCKAGAGKVIAAMPDVCLSPPSPPAGPVPIPYPLSSSSSDTSGGSKSVKIGGSEVMLKDKSSYKKSSGDEAATKSLGQGVVTHTLGGKVYFVAWSMDVEFEGENVVRHLDMTTSNHASPMANQSVPWTNIEKMFTTPGGKCAGMDELKLQPYSRKCPKKKRKKRTGHHLIPGRCSRVSKKYSHSRAPVVCVTFGNQHAGTHAAAHAVFDLEEYTSFTKKKKFTYKKARDAAVKSAGKAFEPPKKLSKKQQECIKAQLDAYYKEKPPDGPGFQEGTVLKSSGAKGKVLPSRRPTAPGT